MLNIRSLSNKFYSQKNKKKWMRQRVTRGFADIDIWNLDYHLLTLLPAMIDQLAKTTHGWPQSDEFPEFKDWQNYLFAIAKKFRDAEKLHDEGETIAEMQANYEKACQLVKEALCDMGEHFFALWD